MNNNKTVVLIPAYKPDIKLINLVKELKSADMNVLVVDDGSGEDYKKIFHKVKEMTDVVTSYINLGKGMTLKIGYKYILDNTEYENIITADADGQHTVEDILKISKKLIANKTFVLGSRLFTGYVPLKSKVGNGITKLVFRAASSVNLKDTQTGLRGFKRELLRDMIEVVGDRYEYEMNVLLWAAKNNIEITEVEINTVYEDGNKCSHFNPVKDSIKIYSKIIKYSCSSLISFFIDFILLFVFNYYFNNLILSIVVSRIVSSTVNFIINRHMVFQNKDSVVHQYLKYATLVILILSANVLSMKLLNEVIGINLFVSKIVTEVVLFIASYTIQNKIVFKVKKLDTRKKVIR